MNVAPLIFGLLAAFALIGVLAGVLATRWRPGHDNSLTRPILVGLAGAWAGGVLFTLAPLDMEYGLIGAPIAAVVGAAAAIMAVVNRIQPALGRAEKPGVTHGGIDAGLRRRPQ